MRSRITFGSSATQRGSVPPATWTGRLLRDISHDSSATSAPSALRFRVGRGVSHVEDDFPASIFLLLPDAGVLAVLDDRLAFFVFRVKFVIAVRIAEIAGGRDVRADWSPDQAVVFVVEESHA